MPRQPSLLVLLRVSPSHAMRRVEAKDTSLENGRMMLRSTAKEIDGCNDRKPRKRARDMLIEKHDQICEIWAAIFLTHGLYDNYAKS